MKGFVLRVPLLAAMLATPLLCLGPSFADTAPNDTPVMKAELLFTIPWGDKLGQLKFVPEEELNEATYAGHSSLLVTLPGDLYIYDPGSRRLQRFGPDGIYQAEIQFEPGFRRELTIVALGSLRADRTRPLIVADESGFVAQLKPPASSAEPARPKELLKGVIGETTTVSRIGIINPAGLLVGERTPRSYGISAVLRRYVIPPEIRGRGPGAKRPVVLRTGCGPRSRRVVPQELGQAWRPGRDGPAY